jgi:hypothetical protein
MSPSGVDTVVQYQHTGEDGVVDIFERATKGVQVGKVRRCNVHPDDPDAQGLLVGGPKSHSRKSR